MGMPDTLLLADFWPHGEVARRYDLFNEESGASKRAVFIIGEEGVARWRKIYPGGERPNLDAILQSLEQI
jgi:mycoredoxin-dependent peroxiredoxin